MIAPITTDQITEIASPLRLERVQHKEQPYEDTQSSSNRSPLQGEGQGKSGQDCSIGCCSVRRHGGFSARAESRNQEIQPAPAAIGADVPATYFGPQPSQVQRELVGEYQNLKSGKIDFDKGTITLPLYEGAMKSGETVWYIVTDTDDKGNADQLGLNYSPKLTFADVGRAVRKATLDSKFKLIFDVGTVDFSPKRSVTPGDAPNFFPPKQFQPSGVGDKDYTPLVKITNAGGHIYNAPVVAYNVSADVAQPIL